ncbi:cAMP and cAMP-inhibited cGMP 3',5'-cyclic phosphodiesterase 10A isoform X2 [Nematostella vectensis]|uniref:cAMP and cAMP-inhibited cGMP 3',5'-cyclic phosphodiesterase 10A isoform X2 n=1 Tax=Nematostella vectensis TaxID=45351 RepID=UPI002076F763|nr:cAMP and cAMP-inhibited cGMP 3',5'-cyclic phosphodiesterase 10A isoform X2 [Nematostella vectensis]
MYELVGNIAKGKLKEARVMYELVRNIAKAKSKRARAIHADRFSLYLVDKNGSDIFLYSESKTRTRSLGRQPIGKGGTVAAHVAETGERLFIKDILGDERFPKGIGVEDSTAMSVLCQPIIQSDGTLVGVVELVKALGSMPFEKEDEEILNSYLVWGSIAIHHAEISKQITKQKDLNTFLLNVVRSIFDEACTMDTVIEKIMAFAKKLVNADRCSLFLLDQASEELFANLFDDGNEDGSFRCGNEIRFPVSKGIAGYVACTGSILNIRDAYRDERFNREVDMKTGYTTHTILCVPVRCKGSIIGVCQMVNSHNGFFSPNDMQSFEMFAGYCGLALHYSKMYNSLFCAQQKHQVALEVISYHCCASEKETEEFLNSADLVMLPPAFNSWEFDMYQDNDALTYYFIKMTQDLFDHCNVRVDLETIARFSLSVRKCYRDIPYHNWCHAFSVAHSLWIVIRDNESLTDYEKLSLFIAGICHDVDHRGKNNAFMLHCKTPLANLYTTSTMEWHHFKQGVFILESEGQNVFGQLDAESYRRVLELIQEAIIATDLMLFFGNKKELETLQENKAFRWEEEKHRSLIRCLLMTACDLCTSAKPWDIQVVAVNKVFEEFYIQGDEERKMGLDPLPMMDRSKHDDLPENQVGFLKGIVRPCYSLLMDFVPEMAPLITYVDGNLRKWTNLAKKQQARNDSNSLLIPEEERIKRSISFIDY